VNRYGQKLSFSRNYSNKHETLGAGEEMGVFVT
jgi:hypothetical protein